MRALALAIVLAVGSILAACGGDGRQVASDDAADGLSAARPGSEAPGGGASAQDPGGTGEAVGPNGGTGPGSGSGGAGSAGTGAGTSGQAGSLPLTVTLNATCAERGDLMEATVETVPDAQIALAVSYNDRDFTPDIQWVPRAANVTGRYVWRWTLRPDTPLGEARLVAVVGSQEGGANAEVLFEVRSEC